MWHYSIVECRVDIHINGLMIFRLEFFILELSYYIVLDYIMYVTIDNTHPHLLSYYQVSSCLTILVVFISCVQMVSFPKFGHMIFSTYYGISRTFLSLLRTEFSHTINQSLLVHAPWSHDNMDNLLLYQVTLHI